MVATYLFGSVIALHPDIGFGGRASLQLLPFRWVFDLAAEGNSFYEARNVVGNLGLFVPTSFAMGLLLQISPRRAAGVVAMGVFLIEATQYLALERVADIDDIILAALGAYFAAMAGRWILQRLAGKARSSHHSPVILAIAAVAGSFLTGCNSPVIDQVDSARPLNEENALAILGLEDSDRGNETRNESVFEFEARVQECMNKQGFRGYPFGLVTDDEGVGFLAPYTDSLGRDLRDDDFVSEFGYGFTAAAMLSLGYISEGNIPEPEPSLHTELADQMADAELTAFYDALGDSSSGCYGEVSSDSALGLAESSLEDLRLDLEDDLAARIESDPQIIELERRWTSCVAEEGYGTATANEFHDRVSSALQGVLETESEPTEDALLEVLDLEVSLASVDLNCGGGPEMQLAWDQEYDRLEAEFIEDNMGDFLAAASN